MGACQPKQGCPSWTPSFSPLPRVSLLLVSRRLPANAELVSTKRVVAFVLFAQGSANRSVCSQVWKEHLVVQQIFVFSFLMLGPHAQLSGCLDLLQEDKPLEFFVWLG